MAPTLPGGVEDPRSEPAGGLQRAYLGGASVAAQELVREPQHPADVGATEPVDRLVGVAHDQQVAPVAGQRPEQRHLRGVGVLVLVDDDVAELVAQHRLVLGVAGDQQRAVHQLAVVEQVLRVEDLEVAREELGRRDPRGLTVAPADRRELVGVEAQHPGAGQHGLQLAGHAPGAQRGEQSAWPADRGADVARHPHLRRRAQQQLPDAHVLLGRGHQGRRAPGQRLGRSDGAEPERQRELAVGCLRVVLAGVGEREPAHQRVAERVERHRDRAVRRATEPRGDPRTQLLGRLAAERQHQHLVGAHPAALDPVDDGLDQRRGLAGAGAGEHEDGSAVVVDHRLLVGVELRGVGRRTRGALQGVPDAHRDHQNRCR